MSEIEIKRGIDRIMESLRAEIAELKDDRHRFEMLADLYWKQLCQVSHERDALKAKARELEATLCRSPVCQLCQTD
jgi:hypothetical protein